MTRVDVHKFGGAALDGAAAISAAARIIAAQGSTPCVVVASAMAGVTDELLRVVHNASVGTAGQAEAAVEHLARRHVDVAHELGALPLVETIGEAFDGLRRLAEDVSLHAAALPSHLDSAAARGERLSARLLAWALRASGVAAAYVDATEVIRTDGAFGRATPDLRATVREARRVLRPIIARGVVPVMPGFIGAGAAGGVVTLGRGGSDLTATLLARALFARTVTLWKDVPGLMTGDPRWVPGVRVISRLHVSEAAEIAQYGARVLHPGTLVPVTPRTRVHIRPFAHPAAEGSEISARPLLQASPVRAVAATMDQALVTVSGRGLSPRPAIAARAFVALDAAGIAASFVTQSATEYAFAITVPNSLATAAVEALREALRTERTRGEIEAIDARVGVATLGVVGSALACEPGVAARVFGALASREINVVAAAQGGGTGGSLSVVVDATRAVDAQRAIHAEFQLHRVGGGRRAAATHVDIVVLGAGAIGRELLTQLAGRGTAGGRTLRVCAVVDSSGWVFERGGLSRRTLAALHAHKDRGEGFATATGGSAGDASEALARIAEHALSRPVLVDATAADTGPLLEEVLGRGWDVVLANKVPLAADSVRVARLLGAARAHGCRLLHEATVGAGLPVIDTLRKLQEAGDRILRIEGCPSGTLGYLFGELGRGRPFSAALRAAMDAGYTEPDARLDLSGMDVARKALILGRLIGFGGDLCDVAVESWVPAHLREVPTPEFVARLGEADAEWEARVHAAAAAGCVLRYRAQVTPRAITVGLVEVPVSQPLATLTGTDNQFAFTTTRYRLQPLVITGPGAGRAVTAAGIVGDLLRLAAEDRRPSVPSGRVGGELLSSPV